MNFISDSYDGRHGKTLTTIPKTIDDAMKIQKVLFSYVDEFYTELMMAFGGVFVFIQSFAIPGRFGT